MLRLYRGLAARFLISFVAIAAATLAVMFVAAWTEGRSLRWSTIHGFVPALAANLAAAWTLSRWRHEGGDVAVAALGGRSAPLTGFVIALTLPALGWSQQPLKSRPGWTLEVAPDAVVVHGPRGETVYEWSGQTATRRDIDGEATFPRLPAPRIESVPSSPPAPWVP